MLQFYKNLIMSAIKVQSISEWAGQELNDLDKMSEANANLTAQKQLEATRATLASMDKSSSVEELEKKIGEISSIAREQAGKVLLGQIVENYIHNNPGLEWEFQRQFLAVDFDSTDSIFDNRAFDASAITILAKYDLSQSDLITALNNRLSASADTVASEDIAMNQWPVEISDTLQARGEEIQHMANIEQGYTDAVSKIQTEKSDRIADAKLAQIAKKSQQRQAAENDIDIPTMEEIANAEAKKEAEEFKNNSISQMAEMEQGYTDTAENLEQTIALRELSEIFTSLDITNIPQGETTAKLQNTLNAAIGKSGMEEIIGKSELAVDGDPGQNTRKAIQLALNTMTESDAPLEIDGKIGNKTVAALSNLENQILIAKDTSWNERLNTAHAPLNEDTGERIYAQDTTSEGYEETV